MGLLHDDSRDMEGVETPNRDWEKREATAYMVGFVAVQTEVVSADIAL
jgi:hypothetical protein